MDDAELHHVIKLLAGSFEALRSKLLAVYADWWPCGLDAMSDIVLDGLLAIARLRCSREFCQVSFVVCLGSHRLEGWARGLVIDTMPWMCSCVSMSKRRLCLTSTRRL